MIRSFEFLRFDWRRRVRPLVNAWPESRRGRPPRAGLVLAALVVAFQLGLALSGRSQNIVIDWFTVDDGGGASTNEIHALDATLGQPDAGVMENAVFRLEGGFWPAAISAGPFIVKQPTSVVVNPGDTVMCMVIGAGDIPLSYQWRLNGVNLAGQTNATLTISNAQLGNGGTYTAVVWNNRGVIHSLPATLSFM